MRAGHAGRARCRTAWWPAGPAAGLAAPPRGRGEPRLRMCRLREGVCGRGPACGAGGAGFGARGRPPPGPEAGRRRSRAAPYRDRLPGAVTASV